MSESAGDGYVKYLLSEEIKKDKKRKSRPVELPHAKVMEMADEELYEFEIKVLSETIENNHAAMRLLRKRIKDLEERLSKYE